VPLTDKQRAALSAKADEIGVSADDLIAEAEAMSGQSNEAPGASGPVPSPKAEKPNLYMYLLPFVTVNEVRTVWLGLGAVSGGDEYAGTWAAKQAGGIKPTDGEAP
jgi:hypothetical protein